MTRRERQLANRAKRYATPSCAKAAQRVRRLLRGRYRDRRPRDREAILHSINPTSNPYAITPPPESKR